MPELIDYPRFAWQLANGTRARMEAELCERRLAELAPYLAIDRQLDVLDLGSGRLRPQYAMLRAAGHRVVGVDLANRPESGASSATYRAMRRLYAAQLGLGAAAMYPESLLAASVDALPLPDGRFDLAISNAAFEHFLDVPAVLREVARTLRPGGIIWAGIHLFTSPSGGHDVSFTQIPLRTLPRGARPWDHLRGRSRGRGVPLNEWRMQQYLDAFAARFTILDQYCGTREGQQWLASDARADLHGYSDDELTCQTLVIVAQKPGRP